MSNLYPNLRGSAPRDKNKVVRVATHLHGLQILFDFIKPEYAIEHGMGFSSTQWLHQKNLQVILSYEDVAAWRGCNPCRNIHVVLPYSGIDDLNEQVKTTIPDIEKTICLVDGPGPQRIDILFALIKMGAPGIAYHDAETLTLDEVLCIKEVEKESGYFIRQYVGMNPETLICSKVPFVHGADFVEL